MQQSKTIVGTMRWTESLNQAQAAQLIHDCCQLGLTVFDLADIYGGYQGESFFGKALQQSGITRENIQIISKCGILYPTKANHYQVKAYDLSKTHVLHSVHNSLRNLQTDYLDLLLVHRPSPLMNLEELAETATELINSGKIKNFGVSNFGVLAFESLHKLIPLATNQIELSLSQPQALFNEQLLQLQNHKIQAQAWSPLGNYFVNPEHEKNQRIKSVLDLLTKKYGASEAQLLIAFVRKHHNQVLPILGSTQFQRIKEIQDSKDLQLELEDWFLLLEASRGHRVA